MHRYRRQAKYAAWYDEPGDTPSKNPFRKYRSHSRGIGDEEDPASRTRTNQTENDFPQSVELNRRQQNMQDLEQPKHASTMPVAHSPIEAPSTSLRGVNEEQHEAEKSQDSAAGTSDTVVEPLSSDPNSLPDQGPRRRKTGILNKLHLKKKDDGGQIEKQSSGLFKKDTQKFTLVSQLRATLLNSWINVLLVFVPIGIAVNYAHIPPVGIFVINFIAIIPLAAMLSYATEEIALRTGETIGGLLNATFGNAVELIVSILALVKGEVDIVQESLIGSMLSNLLLVMGMCFFFGGISRVRQHFNVTVAQTASSLLALAVGSLIIPAAFQAWADGSQQLKTARITQLSRGTAILLLVVYACYLFFQLKTHASMYNAPSQKVEKRSKKVDEGSAIKNIAKMGAISTSVGGTATTGGTDGMAANGDLEDRQPPIMQEPEEEREIPQLSKWTALFTLAASTALVAICAEFMVDSIDAITAGGAVSRTFVGLILLPIVGNAAEHATAVTVACKDKMDLAIGVAVGSSMQIALLVIPFTVVLGWILKNEEMNLAFDSFQIAVLFVSVLLVNYLIQDGESHWLEGVLLMVLYMIIAIAAWFYPPDDPATINSKF